MDELETCCLCGAWGRDVRVALIRWRTGEPFGSGPRCKDEVSCRQRVLEQGEEWLVADTVSEREDS